jgi:hypothetical protein
MLLITADKKEAVLAQFQDISKILLFKQSITGITSFVFSIDNSGTPKLTSMRSSFA